MFYCEHCGAAFSEPDYETGCYEADNGVMSLFTDHHYYETAICPECGSADIEEFYCDVCETCEHKYECENH